MQKKSIRIITGSHYRAHTSPILKRLRFFTLEDLYKLQVSKYVPSFIQSLLPSSLHHIFTLAQNQHGHNTRHLTSYKLVTPKTRTLAASQSIIQMGLLTWNLLWQDIYMRNSMLISYVGFPSIFKSATLDSYDDQSDWSYFFTSKWRAYLCDKWDMIFGWYYIGVTSSELWNIKIYLIY